ncbi:hypothetical protein [Nocardia sp. CDC160]|nr:hypothetical protein [Nocardia sp. CDC160]MEC3915590.1 hypothetical protein [Nocardia sp. CDC160]
MSSLTRYLSLFMLVLGVAITLVLANPMVSMALADPGRVHF